MTAQQIKEVIYAPVTLPKVSTLSLVYLTNSTQKIPSVSSHAEAQNSLCSFCKSVPGQTELLEQDCLLQ